MRDLATVLPLFFAAALTLSATPVLLSPGEIYRVTFTTDPIGTPCPGVCDTLAIIPNFMRPAIGITTTAELYDDPTLLGTEIGVGSQCCNQAFIAAGSIYTLNNPTTVDFTTILNDKIHGRIDISVTGGSLSQYEITSADLLLGHGSAPNGFSFNRGSLTLTSAVLITPEPSSFEFVFLGLSAAAGAMLLRRRPAGAC